MNSNGVKGPMTGIKVLDWTMWQFGPVASSMMGDMGADVVKIESLVGDGGRALSVQDAQNPEFQPERNSYFETCNRNKRGIAVDLKTEEGRAIVYKLVETADVFVENFRKGVAERLGVDYATLSKINPKLVYASASGYGPEGPDAYQPSFDTCGQARGGLMMTAAQHGSTEPPVVGAGVADQMGAVMLCFGVLAALVARDQQGIGQKIDASHLSSIMWLQGLSVSMGLIDGQDFGPINRKDPGNPLWNHYRCKDGRWVVLTMPQADRYWPTFAEVLGIPDLINDSRYADIEARSKNSEELTRILDERFLTRTYAEWDEAFRTGGDFIFSKVQSLDELEHDTQVIANDYIVPFDHPALGSVKMCNHPVTYSKTPAGIHREAPELGQHTEEILLEAGYDWDGIEKLQQAGAIR